MSEPDEDCDIKHLMMDPGKMFQMTIPINDFRPMYYDDPEAQADFQTLRKGIGLRTGEADRVDTPDRDAIIDLSTSFGKHRLKKQTQLLQDIAHRCRVQEVTDLSGALTKKCKLSQFEGKQAQREYTFHSGIYNTTKMSGTHRLAIGNAVTNSQTESEKVEENASPTHTQESTSPSPRPKFERSNTMFPPRQARKSTDRSSPTKGFPRLQISYTKGTRPESRSKNALAKTRKINGPIQLRHYLQPRPDHLAPLILPSIKFVGYGKKDNVENYVNSRKMMMTPRHPPTFITQSQQRGVNQSPFYDTISLPVAHRSNTSYGAWNTSKSTIGAVNVPPSSPTRKNSTSKISS